jgi:hypothetical protein
LIRSRLPVLRRATRPCLETPSYLFSFAHQRSCAEELHVHCTAFPSESRRCCGATSPIRALTEGAVGIARRIKHLCTPSRSHTRARLMLGQNA